MSVIVIRHQETKKEFYRHELTQDEKPWEVLSLLEKMQFKGLTIDKKEYVMDPQDVDDVK